MSRVRIFAWIGVAGALWGLIFAGLSTLDYASHLDRGWHDLHCSLNPGAEATASDEGCRVALNSPYSALFKARLWGGIPISLFGLGCFSFLLGHAAAIASSPVHPSRAEGLLYGLLALSPLCVSLVMFSISWFELGTVCLTCAGIYSASLALGVSGAFVIKGTWGERRGRSRLGLAAAAVAGLGVSVITPSIVYAALAPDHSSFISQCGRIKIPKEPHGALLELGSSGKPALFFEDPLCPTCKSLHERLKDTGVLDRLDADLALFPLDSQCNWMLKQPTHPGACTVSKALLCAPSPSQMLDWVYAEQDELAEAGKAGDAKLLALLEGRWGRELVRCIGKRATDQRLNRHLHFATQNAILVSTPQVFIDGQRLCDEDIDMGLMFALGKLAPELVP